VILIANNYREVITDKLYILHIISFIMPWSHVQCATRCNNCTWNHI